MDSLASYFLWIQYRHLQVTMPRRKLDPHLGSLWDTGGAPSADIKIWINLRSSRCDKRDLSELLYRAGGDLKVVIRDTISNLQIIT